MSVKSEKRFVEKYLAEHGLEKIVNEVLNVCLRERPVDPFAQMSNLFRERSKAGMGILDIRGRLVLACDGGEACEVEVRTDNGSFCAMVSEAGVWSSFKRVHCTNFLSALKNGVAQALIGLDPTDMEGVDRALIEADDSEDKGTLGVNSLYAASVAVCRAGAASRNLALHQYLAQLAGKREYVVPVPWMLGLKLTHEEIGLVPIGVDSFQAAVDTCRRVTRSIAERKLASSTPLREAVDNIIEILKEAELASVVALAISVLDSDIVAGDSGLDEEDAASISSPVNADGGEKEEQDDKEKEEKSDKKTTVVSIATTGDSQGSGSGEDDDTADTVFDRAGSLAVIKDLFEDEATQNMVVIAENLFYPHQIKAMAHFVEEHGHAVVLFNKTDKNEQNTERKSYNIAGKSKHGGNDAASESDVTTVIDSGADNGATYRDGDAELSASGSATTATIEGKAGDSDRENDGDNGFPPCNGDKIYVGTPYAGICTVSDLIQEFERCQNQGQAVVVVWEERNATTDSFPADVAIALGSGLVKVGPLNEAGNIAKVNQLIRLEQELGAEAFYAGNRFRLSF